MQVRLQPSGNTRSPRRIGNHGKPVGRTCVEFMTARTSRKTAPIIVKTRMVTKEDLGRITSMIEATVAVAIKAKEGTVKDAKDKITESKE